MLCTGDCQTCGASVPGCKCSCTAGLPVGDAAEAELSMLDIAAEGHGLVDGHVGSTVSVHGCGVLDLLTRKVGRNLRGSCGLPSLSVEIFEDPVLVTGSGSTRSELDLYHGTGLDRSLSVEEPVVARPRSGATRILAGDVHLELLVAIGPVKVVRHVFDISLTLDSIELVSRSEGGVVGILEAGGLDFILQVDLGSQASVGNFRYNEIVDTVRRSDIIARHGDVVEVEGRKSEACQRGFRLAAFHIVHDELAG